MARQRLKDRITEVKETKKVRVKVLESFYVFEIAHDQYNGGGAETIFKMREEWHKISKLNHNEE